MEKTIRHSKKRDAILAAIRSTDCHPSAEWVHQTLKPTHPDLSLGTVYRNLTFFREQGDIQSVGVVKGQERFDGTTTPHSHFVCNCCGSVSDLHRVDPHNDLESFVRREYGVQVDRHELTFFGLCSACMPTDTKQ